MNENEMRKWDRGKKHRVDPRDEPIPDQAADWLQLTPTDLRRAAAGILENTMKAMTAAVLQGGTELNWNGVHAAIDRAAKLHVMSLRQKGAKVTENA